MTRPVMDLRELVVKSGDAALLRGMIGFAAERLMELEAGSQAGAGHGQKSLARLAQRNGYRDRDWQRRAGNVELRIQTLRAGSYLPSVLAPPRRAVEKALTAVIRAACVHGVSTWAMDEFVQAMGGTANSKSQVSRLREEIAERIDTFQTRPIDGEWPCLWIDATYLKVRQGGRIMSVAVICAVGVTNDGRREALGMSIGPSHAFTGLARPHLWPWSPLTPPDRLPARSGAAWPVGRDVGGQRCNGRSCTRRTQSNAPTGRSSGGRMS